MLQHAAGRTDPVATHDQLMSEPGSRYIDFLIPGLLGMNLMGSAIWGMGFAIVDARRKKLMKRLIATPMRGKVPRQKGLIRAVEERLRVRRGSVAWAVATRSGVSALLLVDLYPPGGRPLICMKTGFSNNGIVSPVV